MRFDEHGRLIERQGNARFLVAPLATVMMAGLAGCLADDFAVSVGGEATGIAEGTLEITLNSSETLSLDSDGGFEFSSQLKYGESYSVSIDAYPDHSHCAVSNAEGIAGDSDISDILVECEVLSLGAANEDQAVQLDWTRAGDVDIAYSTDSGCDWVNVNSCDNGGVIADQSGGALTVDESHGLLADELYSFVLMVGDQASRPVQGVSSRFELSGWVKDTVVHGERVYAGGNFLLNGAPVRGLADFRADTDEASFTGSVFEVGGGSVVVYDAAEAPDGGRFIAGDFTSINGIDVNHLVRLNPDGSLDESWSADLPSSGGVMQLAVDEDENRLYIAGEFSEVSGDTGYANLAALDLDGNLDTGFDPASPDGAVWAMAVSDDRLYIGGEFGQVGTETREHVAAFDIDDGTLDAAFVADTDDEVRVIRHDQDRVLLGGMFTTINTTGQAHVGAVDASDGSLNADFDPVVDGNVLSITEADGQLLVGGAFSQIDGTTRTGIAALDPQNGDLLDDWDVAMTPQFPSSPISGVLTIHADDDFIYLGGEFIEVSGEDRNGVARFARDTGALDQDWTPLLDPVRVWHLGGGEHLTVGGQFRGAGGTRLDNVAAFDLATGQLDASWEVGTDDEVNALETDGQQLFVGGEFAETYSGSDSFSHAYATAVDLDDGSNQGWNPEPDGRVNAMVMHGTGDYIYLGGGFSTVGSATRTRLALVDVLAGDPVVTDDPNISGTVYDLAWADSYDSEKAVIIGGNFSSARGTTRENHAVLSEYFGAVHPTAFDPDSHLFSVHYNNSESYQMIGGGFQNVAGETQAWFAAFESDTTFDGTSPEANGWVYASNMDAGEGRVFVGGSFWQFGGETRRNLAIMDYSSGSGLSLSDDAVDLDGWVRDIELTADHVVLGGNFVHVAGERRARLVILDRDSLEPVSFDATSQGAPSPVVTGASNEASRVSTPSSGSWER